MRGPQLRTIARDNRLSGVESLSRLERLPTLIANDFMSRMGGRYDDADSRSKVICTLARDRHPARTRPEARCSRAGMEVGQEELAALARVIESKNLFRYYGVGDGPDEVARSSVSSRSSFWHETPPSAQRGFLGAHLRVDRAGVGRATGDRPAYTVECHAERGACLRARFPSSRRWTSR